MKVSYFLRDDGACGLYRLEQPLKALAQYTDTSVMKTERGDPVSQIIKATDCDVFVIPRPCEENWPNVFKAGQERGCKIVVDHDDNMFAVSPMSPHYKDFGVEDIEIPDHDGTLKPMWVDGVNYDKKANQEKLDGFKRSLEAADMVTVTTDVLADVYREYNDNVVVLPNTIDCEAWKKLPLIKHPQKIKLHWGGGSSHAEDFMMVEPAITEIMKKYPQVELSIAGVMWEWALRGVDHNRVKFIPWTHTQAYPYRMAINNPDIAFIPLLGSEFNACKSNIKWLEMSALEVPSVTSNVLPYGTDYNGENGIYVDNTTKAWVEGLSILIEDSLLRNKMGGEARRTVETKYDIHKYYALWEQAYKELVNGP